MQVWPEVRSLTASQTLLTIWNSWPATRKNGEDRSTSIGYLVELTVVAVIFTFKFLFERVQRKLLLCNQEGATEFLLRMRLAPGPAVGQGFAIPPRGVNLDPETRYNINYIQFQLKTTQTSSD